MKRSKAVELIASWAKPEIRYDVYNDNLVEWADNLLFTLESECGMLLLYNPRYLDHGSIQDCKWDPEDEEIKND